MRQKFLGFCIVLLFLITPSFVFSEQAQERAGEIQAQVSATDEASEERITKDLVQDTEIAQEEQTFREDQGEVIVAKKSLKTDLEKATKVVLKPIEQLKDKTNRILPDKTELVSSEKSSNDKDVGPRIKLQF